MNDRKFILIAKKASKLAGKTFFPQIIIFFKFFHLNLLIQLKKHLKPNFRGKRMHISENRFFELLAYIRKSTHSRQKCFFLLERQGQAILIKKKINLP